MSEISDFPTEFQALVPSRDFQRDLEELLKRHGIDARTSTPAPALAAFLWSVIEALKEREQQTATLFAESVAESPKPARKASRSIA